MDDLRILFLGPLWVGGWIKGMQRAAAALGYKSAFLYYNSVGNQNAINQSDHLLHIPTKGGTERRLRQVFPSGVVKRILPFAEQAIDFAQQKVDRRLVDYCNTIQPDIVIILRGETIGPETIADLGKSGRPVVAWWVDDPLRFPQTLNQFEHLDALFVFDRGRFAELEASGAHNIHYLPCAFDPSVYSPECTNENFVDDFGHDVVFVGAYYPERAKLALALRDHDLGIWGDYWKKTKDIEDFPRHFLRGGEVQGKTAACIYQAAKISINLHHRQTRIGGLNMRTFEIPATGGFELVDYVQGVEDLFDLEKELVVYRSMEEMYDLVDYFLNNSSKRKEIAQQGQLRAQSEHTFKNRLATILQTMGLP